MADETKEESLTEEAADPYGDVPLGVECAWPQSLPTVQAMASELQT